MPYDKKNQALPFNDRPLRTRFLPGLVIQESRFFANPDTRRLTEEIRKIWKDNRRARSRELGNINVASTNMLTAEDVSMVKEVQPKLPKIPALSKDAAACIRRDPPPRPKFSFEVTNVAFSCIRTNNQPSCPSHTDSPRTRQKAPQKQTKHDSMFYAAHQQQQQRESRNFHFISPDWSSERDTLNHILQNDNVLSLKYSWM